MLNERQKGLLDYIKFSCFGTQNSQHRVDIAFSLYGKIIDPLLVHSEPLTNDITKMIKQLKKQGYPIISNSAGIYYGTSYDVYDILEKEIQKLGKAIQLRRLQQKSLHFVGQTRAEVE